MTAYSSHAPSKFALVSAFRFFRLHPIAVLSLSALLLIPCYWHTHIQAGDLGSHIYNAWLAQLAERHQVEGVAVVRQWNNVLFDLLVSGLVNWLGFSAAEKVAVSLVVLIFFWGSFAFIGSVSGRAPWQLTPFLFLLAYGYTFHMGFMNFHLSVGLAFAGLAMGYRGGGGNWLTGGAIGGLSLVAHPIGFLLFVGVTAYLMARRFSPERLRVVLLTVAVICFIAARYYFKSHEELEASWRSAITWAGLVRLLGQDQMNVYGHRYEVLSWFGLAWGLLCAAAGVYDWIFRAEKPAKAMPLAVELYVVTVIGTLCLPENFRASIYAGLIGLLVSRLTLVAGVFGLLGLSSLSFPRWTWSGGAVIAAVFFAFLYQDTGKLDRMETNARALAAKLAPGTRIVAVASAPDDWRVGFIYHSIDRACIGQCFSFANYEASSRQFRVRALPGSRVVTPSVDQSDDMSSGEYIVRAKDLPLISIYQCDDKDFTKLCALALREGQKTEDPESEPVPAPADEADSAN